MYMSHITAMKAVRMVRMTKLYWDNIYDFLTHVNSTFTEISDKFLIQGEDKVGRMRT